MMKYVLFGTGDYYKRFKHWFDGRKVIAVLDNDPKKQGTIFDGYPVMAPTDINSIEYDAIVILSFYITEMKKQLIELGVAPERIFHFYDLHELFLNDKKQSVEIAPEVKSILLLSHDLSLGGPALALYHAAVILKHSGYEVVYASMLDGELRNKLEDSFIPVVIDERLQIGTMNELVWTKRYDLIICNTINYNIFLSERDEKIPVIWWLHDSPFFYEGIKCERLNRLVMTNMKMLSVGPVPRSAMNQYKPDVMIEDLIYGVSNNV